MDGDGIHSLVPYEKMTRGAQKLRDTYAIKPDAPLFMKEFGWYVLEKWESQGKIRQGEDKNKLFGFDTEGRYGMQNVGFCEAGFCPEFEEKILEDRGEHELIQDFAGRKLLCFKGRRSGFMPEYVDHPVKDLRTWKELCEWRLDPRSPERYKDFEKTVGIFKEAASRGVMISEDMVGGYMYLRSLIGPEGLLYMFYDNPDLIHTCMRKWLELADHVIAKFQEHLTFDEIFLGEDICYNVGPLISPDMMKEFLFPYYQQLIANMKKRQIDKSRKLYFQVDSDGRVDTVLDVYRSIGLDMMSPFEVASGSDVVRTGKEYPDLIISGGFDKRILAKGKEAIDREVDRIMPVMKKRGGYIPTCDHGVPEEVEFEDYAHFRKRLLEFA